MHSSNYRVRRATLDDIQGLMVLWTSMNYPAEELARRITEFQVAETAAGQLLGAVGLQVAERQALIYYEAFIDFAQADSLRPMLWDRIHTVAMNMGLLRLWTAERAPFWRHCGLVPPDAAALEKLPTAWQGQSSGWLTLKLREDLDAVITADKQFALFMATEKQRTDRVLQQARMVKIVLTSLIFILACLVLGVAVWLALRRMNPR